MAVTDKEKFGFPFEPYRIQVDFMNNLYEVLDKGKIGIFESPTGTGKSLSLICGTIAWLKYYEKKNLEDLEKQFESKTVISNSNFDWFNDFVKKKEDELNKEELKQKYENYKNREDRIKRIKENKSEKICTPIDSEFDDLFKNADDIRAAVADELKTDCEDDGLVLADYDSDDETKSVEEQNTEDDNDLITRIYYCSRTHSQLVQFVREIQKTPFVKNVRVVSLASRQTTCINDSVNKLKSISLINDQCLNLQKNKKGKSTLLGDDNRTVKKKKTSQGCPFYKAKFVDALEKEILTQVLDIEQIVEIGKKKLGCPYYACRKAAPDAELIVLPYNTLLHKKTREASGVKLKNSVVIIDEAHNLTDAITNIHSAEITGAQLLIALSQLQQYQQKYKLRLNAKNMLYTSQLLFILNKLIKQMEGKDDGKVGTYYTKIFKLNDFLNEAMLANMNLFKIVAFCETSEIARKLYGFVEKYQNPTQPQKERVQNSATSAFLQKMCYNEKSAPNEKEKLVQVEKSKENFIPSSPLNQIATFLDALTNSNKDGRIVVNIKETVNTSTLKFMLLNPSSHFKEIIADAKAVVVAGGTMQPVSEFVEQLFIPAGAESKNILNFSYGHVIPDDHLVALVMGKGPSGMELNFSYENRQKQPNLIDELGRLLCNISNVIPGGIVCFFPSYDYANIVCEQWTKSKLLDRLSIKKKIFKEPKTSIECQEILSDYTKSIQNCKPNERLTGAILFSVVGGKMSEGINFSDDLGRCVVMIGLPYPNSNSPELKEKINYLNNSMPKSASGQTPGQIYYDNLCMKAVNQSIGRAIRHINDYATILLVDSRYSRPHIQNSLPTWISSRLQNVDSFGQAFSSIRKFFSNKK